MDSEPLDNLNLKCKDLSSLCEILDKKVRNSEARAGQSVGCYVIFQAIMMYIDVVSSSVDAAALQGKRWVPVCLSAVVSVPFWLSFVTTVNDCIRIRRRQDMVFLEQEKLHRKIFAIRTGRKQRDGGSAAHHSLAVLQFQRYTYVGIVYSAFFSFTLMVSYALLPTSVARLLLRAAAIALGSKKEE